MNRPTVSGVRPAVRSLSLTVGLACGLVVGMLGLPVPAVALETYDDRFVRPILPRPWG